MTVGSTTASSYHPSITEVTEMSRLNKENYHLCEPMTREEYSNLKIGDIFWFDSEWLVEIVACKGDGLREWFDFKLLNSRRSDAITLYNWPWWDHCRKYPKYTQGDRNV